MVWALSLAAAWAVGRSLAGPAIDLPAWTRRDSVALALVLLMVPALVTRPFVKVGATDDAGSRQYRAYFIADFVWHAALTAELAKHEPRPRNPFLADEPVHYYWTYFRIPATLSVETGLPVQDILKLNAFATALLLVASIFLAAWAALPGQPMMVALAVALTTLCASVEGLAGLADIVRRGLPLSEVRDLNIDAIAAWAFKGLRIDNLPRTMWYTPQHGFACALGLLAIPVGIIGGVRAKPSAIFLAGLALAGSLAFNPLLGVVFCAVYGVTVLLDANHQRSSPALLLRHALAVLPVAIAFGWCSWNEVGEGAGAALHVGFFGLARNSPVVSFLLQFGPLLLPMAVGIPATAQTKGRSIWPAATGVAIAIVVMHFIALTVDLAWVGFRGGNLFFVFAPAIVAQGLMAVRQRGRFLVSALVMFVMALGLPTTIIDAFNAQDVANRGLSRDAERARGFDVAFNTNDEFHWTVLVTAPEQEALNWIRVNTNLNAVVQMEPTIRGRETWSLVPSFAERRMATGVAIPLLPVPEYAERNPRVRSIYASNDAKAAWETAKALGIDYLYVDSTERAAYYGVAKFDANPQYFERVFQNREASVYALRP